MRYGRYFLVGFAALFLACGTVFGIEGWGPEVVSDSYTLGERFKVTLEVQHEEVGSGGESALALNFETFGKWHFYSDNSLVPGGKLVVAAAGEGLVFGDPVFPASHLIEDEILEKSYGVYDGQFTVFMPFTVDDGVAEGKIPVMVKMEGAICAEMCLFLKENAKVSTDITIKAGVSMADPEFTVPDVAEVAEREDKDDLLAKSEFTMPVAFSLALIAGLLLNVMPCVWPILPIIITRLWNLSGQSRAKSMGMGIGFSIGILLFFAIIAGANITLRIGFGEVMGWGELNLEPAFNIGLSMLMVVMALFMFGLFTFALPSSIAGKSGSGEGFSGSIGMGFLLALLSTPCGFGILVAAFAWAQSQSLWLATITIMLIGVGMALPYIFLTAIPGLLNRLPRPGGWMDNIKYILGFLLLLIAVKTLSGVPADMRINTLYFAVFLSLAVWIWGWVNLSTTRGHKIVIRSVAILIAVSSGWLFLSGPTEKAVDWLEYDQAAIAKDIKEGKPVLIKFTADWCTTCTVIDKFVYSKKEVGDFLKQKGVRPYLADAGTRGAAATVDLRKKYKELAIPFTIIHLPDGKEERLKGMYRKKTLYEILESLDDVEGFDGEEEDQGQQD